MIIRTTRNRIIALNLISLVFLGGCTNGSHIPKSGVKTEDIYHAQEAGESNPSTNWEKVLWRPSTEHERAEVDFYTLHNTPRPNYQFLDNPTIHFYVPPKLSSTDRVPIPGYFSEFKLYERDEYALPSERNLSNSSMYPVKADK
ncbi:conjugative transfer region lipoprotein, TIGR03751 family [Vibrio xiamenensis]|uniref:Conjugative transfer region lipoprotein, TIGR03751 family n=1 Tax=Vibrio xiamenensis TaxID=861298 RepID=A0A1G8FHL6_9VIBR|nr:hypothetical protein [Vibrio xiamenensis]SDH81634.1 conjugative transfer region lipoprotein, TIGR03751 family [Vibrio xiamenensis]